MSGGGGSELELLLVKIYEPRVGHYAKYSVFFSFSQSTPLVSVLSSNSTPRRNNRNYFRPGNRCLERARSWVRWNCCSLSAVCSGADSTTAVAEILWICLAVYIQKRRLCFWPGPTSLYFKPRVQPGVNPPHLLNKRGVDPGLNPGFGVLRCGFWSVIYILLV
jgi:hypothetical protein